MGILFETKVEDFFAQFYLSVGWLAGWLDEYPIDWIGYWLDG